MSHVRKQLRDAAIAAIKSAVPAFDGRVEKARGFGRNVDQLPCAEISTPGEQSQGATMDGMLIRDIELVVTIRVSGSDNAEDQCDALAVQIEKAILSQPVFDLAQEITPESMAFEISTEGETRIGRMQLSWSVVIHTFENDPETAI